MTCECMTEVNAELKDRGVRLETIFTLGRASGEGMACYPRIPLEKIDRTKRGKVPANMIPTFCPFCGVRYRPEATASPRALDGAAVNQETLS